MKKIIQIIIVFIAIFNIQYSIINAQSLSTKVSPTNGGYFTGGNGASLSWSMGETDIQTLQSTNNMLSQGFQQPEVNLLANPIAGSPFCEGAQVTVPYSATGIIGANNVFTAQLSDATGSFASPLNIGTVTGNTSGSIIATIPFNISAGSNYRIRVTSSLPHLLSNSPTVFIVNICLVQLHLSAFIQGYYLGAGEMQPVMQNEMVSGATDTETDTIHIELHDVNNPGMIIESHPAILMTNGTASASFSGSLGGHSFWVAVKHRNAVQTWSAAPVAFAPSTNYSFSTAQSQAYGSNMVAKDGVWAFYSGDISHDENVDLLDFPYLDADIYAGAYGYYATDLNGDGNTDLLDFPFLDENIYFGRYSMHP